MLVVSITTAMAAETGVTVTIGVGKAISVGLFPRRTGLWIRTSQTSPALLVGLGVRSGWQGVAILDCCIVLTEELCSVSSVSGYASNAGWVYRHVHQPLPLQHRHGGGSFSGFLCLISA